MEPVERYYIKKNIDADDEKSVIKDNDLSIDIILETSTENTEKDKSLKDKYLKDKSLKNKSLKDKSLKDKSLKDELKSDVSKTIIKTLTGQGLYSNRIKIDENLQKKKF